MSTPKILGPPLPGGFKRSFQLIIVRLLPKSRNALEHVSSLEKKYGRDHGSQY
jgi:hypothetical protein